MSVVLIVLMLASPLFAQDAVTGAENPLAQLKAEVQKVVGDANLPFTDDQEKAITLMMEDRRKASEDLFGNLMDFSSGPTRGQESDRLRDAIQWMRAEFLGRLQDYLTPEQLAIWGRYQETTLAASAAETSLPGQAAARRQQSQTQFVRINNNPFTAEDNQYRNRGGGGNFNNNFGGGGGGGGNFNNNNNNRGGNFGGQGGAEVIQRGGAGAFHGNAQVLLKDESLNAGRRFAANKPPYQERQISFDIGGPVIPGRLTSSINMNINRSENVDTIRATLPNGIFALGITRPSTFRGLETRNTLQLSESHSLSFNAGKRSNTNRNQGVGGFVMPDRAADNSGGNWNIEVKQFSAFSPERIYETRFNYNANRNKTVPLTEGLRINVTDTFSSGGAQNRSDNVNKNYEFSNLYTQLGETLTIKTGMEGGYRKLRQLQETNFTGQFTFSSLESYVAGTPLNFRVNRGNPLMELSQWDLGFFFQNDLKLTSRFTLMSGVRYEVQTNMSDHNNIDPRIGIAYAIGRATVIRAGAGIFHQRIGHFQIADHLKQSPDRDYPQYEIIIDNPSYPDPFIAGTLRNRPSVKVIDPKFSSPYESVAMISYERTFLNNLFVSASYDFSRELHRFRFRNLNAPLDLTSPTPASCRPEQSSAVCARPQADRGNIINMESTGSETFHSLRLNFRQRFSIFNLSGNYITTVNWTDTIQNPGNNNSNVSQFGFAADGLPSDSYNLRADWANGAQPVHQLNTTANARLPLGLFLTGTMNFASSRKYTITTGKDDNQDTSVNDRPRGGKRNNTPTPNFMNFNFNISKAFFFGGGQGNSGSQTNVNVFINMTNAFNRPNYGTPSGVMTSSNFGRSTNAGDPREIEAGLRFQF